MWGRLDVHCSSYDLICEPQHIKNPTDQDTILKNQMIAYESMGKVEYFTVNLRDL